jgi:hypothetical protein
VVEDDDTAWAMRSTEVTVTNVPPVVATLDVQPNPVAKGETLTLRGTLADPGLGEAFIVTVDWGDDSLPTTLDLGPGVLSFSAEHQYNDNDPSGTPSDPYSINVIVEDDDTGSGSAGTSVRIRPRGEPARFKSVSVLPNGHILLRLEGTPLASYRIESTRDFEEWSKRGIRVADEAGLFEFEDAEMPLPASRFYQAIGVD